MQTCKTCKYWDGKFCEALADELHRNFEVIIRVADDHGLSHKIKTSENFGCVNHKVGK